MTLEELSNKLYESKVLHDYKDGKIDYRKVHKFIVGLNEALTIPDVVNQRELLLAFVSQLNRADITQIEIAEYELVVDAFLESQ